MTRRGDSRRRVAGREAGSATVELALLAPGLLLLCGLILLGGRVVLAGGSIEQAAAAAARQASLARDPAAADRLARQQAARTLAAQHLQCASLTVTVDTAGFRVPLGQPASVAVEIGCAVRLSDLALPGLPATRALSARAVSPLDPWRARGSGR
ncbi:MAG TPA: TadE/TadG family type IV pilus assembly protein [Mycobacteriales bacterium]|nr:TadE/TadG family type IV pilus assembly protein [Mycobacteriales bacterium]